MATGDNVALLSLGATATADSSYETSQYGPQFAIDGTDAQTNSPNNRWNGWPGGQDPTNEWLRVDLGSAKNISAFKLIQFGGPGSYKYATRVKIEASDDDATWVEKYRSTADEPTLVSLKPLWRAGTHRYWKITCLVTGGSANNGWGIHTFGLIEGDAGTGVNWARNTLLGASATANSSGSVQYDPNYAIDGNNGTYVLVDTGVTGTANVVVDLGGPRLVKSFRLQFVNTVWTPGQYKIESSHDGTVWASRYYRTSTAALGGTDTGRINLYAPVSARYWRIRQISAPAGTTGIGPTDFELWNDASGADPGDDPEEDLAIGGWTLGSTNYALTSHGASATSNRTSYQSTVPNQAINGNDGDYVLLLNGSPAANLVIDLGQSRNICGWAVSWVNDSWYASAYTIEYSTDNSNWTLVHTATGQTMTSGNSSTAFANGAGGAARYWRITFTACPVEGAGPTTFKLIEGTPPAGSPPPKPPKWINSFPILLPSLPVQWRFELPDEVQHGDLVILTVATQPAVDLYSGHPTYGQPSGWTMLNASGQNAVQSMYKVWQTGDARNFYMEFFAGTLNGNAAVHIFRKLNTATPIGGYSHTQYSSGSTPSSTAFDPTDWSHTGTALHVIAWITAGTRPRTMTGVPSGWKLRSGSGNATLGQTQVTTKPLADKTSAPAVSATFDQGQEAHQVSWVVMPEAGSITHEGAASVNGAATQASNLVKATPGTASISAAATTAADGVKQKPGTAECAAAATAGATGSLTLGGIADLTELVAEITEANGVVGIGGKANVDALVVATMNGGYELWAAATPTAAASVEADGKFGTAGQASPQATATAEASGYTVVQGIGDRNALAVVTARATLILNADAEVEAAVELGIPDGKVTKPGQASRFATASATAFGGKLHASAKTVVGRATVDATGATGPGGTAVVAATATFGLKVGVLAQVGSSDPINKTVGRATTAAVADRTLGGISDLEATAEFADVPGTILFEGQSSRFATASVLVTGGFLLESGGTLAVAATTNQPDLVQATPGSSAVAAPATVSQPTAILEKWGTADLEATAATDLLNGNVIFGAATDLVGEATITDSFGGLIQTGTISALAQVFRSAKGGYLVWAAADIRAQATVYVTGLGQTAGNVQVVTEAHASASGTTGQPAAAYAAVTVVANGGVRKAGQSSVIARATQVSAALAMKGGIASLFAVAAISDFNGTRHLAGAAGTARATVAAAPAMQKRGTSSVLARLASASARGTVTRTATGSTTTDVQAGALGLNGSKTEPALPGATVGALGGIWHQGWCRPMAVATTATAGADMTRNARANVSTGSAALVKSIAWARGGFGTAQASVAATPRIRKPAASAISVAATTAAEAIKLVRGAGVPQTGRTTVAAEGLRQVFGAASVTGRATFRGFGGVQGRSDVLAAATATGQAFMSRDKIDAQTGPSTATAATELLAGIWHQALCRPMLVGSALDSAIWMIWGGKAQATLQATASASLARQHQAAGDLLATGRGTARSRVARIVDGAAVVQATTAANGVGLVEAQGTLAAAATVAAAPMRVRQGSANVTGRGTTRFRPGLILEAAGNTSASVTITREGSLVRRRGVGAGTASATVSAVPVVAPRGASFLVARATTSRPRVGYLRAGRGYGVWRVAAALRNARVERPLEGEAVARITASANLVRSEMAAVETVAQAAVAGLAGIVRQTRAALRGSAIVTGMARRDVTGAASVAARATLTGGRFVTRNAAADVVASASSTARIAEGLGGDLQAAATVAGNPGRLQRASAITGARARTLAFAIYEGESAIVLHVTATARGAREQASAGDLATASTATGRAGLRHLASASVEAVAAVSEPLSVNSRIGAGSLAIGATTRGFVGRLQSRTGTAPAIATVAGRLARAVVQAGQAGASAIATGDMGRQLQNEAQALAEVRVRGSQGQELIVQGAMSVSAGASGSIGRRQAGAGAGTGRAIVSGSIRKEQQGTSAVLARALVAARAGLAIFAEGAADQAAEATGELAPTVFLSAEGSGSAEVAASGGFRLIGSAQVVARATRTAKLARVLGGQGSLWAKATTNRPRSGVEVSGEAVVMVGVTVEANSGNEIQGAGAVSAEVAGLALAGVTLQASATAMARGGIVAYEAGTMKAAGGVLLARAYCLAHIAGQVPALAEIVARATVTAAGASAAPWWGKTTVGGSSTSTGSVSPRGPFG